MPRTAHRCLGARNSSPHGGATGTEVTPAHHAAISRQKRQQCHSENRNCRRRQPAANSGRFRRRLPGIARELIILASSTNRRKISPQVTLNWDSTRSGAVPSGAAWCCCVPAIALPPAGLEPATCGLGNRCSIRLSYGGSLAKSLPFSVAVDCCCSSSLISTGAVWPSRCRLAWRLAVVHPV
jgi:hypothetical protein